MLQRNLGTSVSICPLGFLTSSHQSVIVLHTITEMHMHSISPLTLHMPLKLLALFLPNPCYSHHLRSLVFNYLQAYYLFLSLKYDYIHFFSVEFHCLNSTNLIFFKLKSIIPTVLIENQLFLSHEKTSRFFHMMDMT